MQISHLRVTAECEECDNSVINDKSHTGIAQTWLQENLWNKYVKRIIRSAYDAGISDKFLDHIHITDKIVNNLFQVFAGFVRRFTGEQEIDYEIGPDESLEDVLDTAELLQKIEGEEEVEKMDALLSLAITGGDCNWIWFAI